MSINTIAAPSNSVSGLRRLVLAVLQVVIVPALSYIIQGPNN